MFRAGAVTGAPGAGLIPAATTPGILLADISSWQPDIADAAYLAWSRAVVVRAMYGTTVDGAWYGGARRADLHAAGALFTGFYQYLRAGQDAAAQAHALTGLIGNLRQGEKLICDIEEGPTGAQAGRWRQWKAVITAAYGQAADPWLYAGLSFAAVAGLDPQWVAAYRAVEPGGNHVLWQFSDAYPVPGVGTADASVYHGTIEQLAAHGWQAAPVKPPVKPVKPGGPVLSGGHVVSVSNNDAEVAWSCSVPGLRFRVTINGPGPLDGRTNTVPVAKASYSGLTAGSTYVVTVQALVNGQPAGQPGHVTVVTTRT
jgi:hypothetical protein